MSEEAKKENIHDSKAKWYVASAVNGNEVSAVRNLQAKIKAIHYEDLVPDVKVIMTKTVENVYYNEHDPDNKPPKSMKNTGNVTWSVLGNGRYLKQIVRLENKYPGYIFVNMIMTDESWYAVRNSPRITGLVGSSGSGIKPQPIDNEEVENILENTPPYNDYAIVVEEQVVSGESAAPVHYQVGNTVVATIGDEQISGVISNIDEKNNQVSLKTTIFGRENTLKTTLDNIKIEGAPVANENTEVAEFASKKSDAELDETTRDDEALNNMDDDSRAWQRSYHGEPDDSDEDEIQKAFEDENQRGDELDTADPTFVGEDGVANLDFEDDEDVDSDDEEDIIE